MVKIKKRKVATGGIFVGKLHLIDLAGSEDNRKTDNSGASASFPFVNPIALLVVAKRLHLQQTPISR
jgi:hypothetical protein